MDKVMKRVLFGLGIVYAANAIISYGFLELGFWIFTIVGSILLVIGSEGWDK